MVLNGINPSNLTDTIREQAHDICCAYFLCYVTVYNNLLIFGTPFVCLRCLVYSLCPLNRTIYKRDRRHAYWQHSLTDVWMRNIPIITAIRSRNASIPYHSWFIHSYAITQHSRFVEKTIGPELQCLLLLSTLFRFTGRRKEERRESLPSGDLCAESEVEDRRRPSFLRLSLGKLKRESMSDKASQEADEESLEEELEVKAREPLSGNIRNHQNPPHTEIETWWQTWRNLQKFPFRGSIFLVSFNTISSQT